MFCGRKRRRTKIPCNWSFYAKQMIRRSVRRVDDLNVLMSSPKRSNHNVFNRTVCLSLQVRVVLIGSMRLTLMAYMHMWLCCLTVELSLPCVYTQYSEYIYVHVWIFALYIACFCIYGHEVLQHHCHPIQSF